MKQELVRKTMLFQNMEDAEIKMALDAMDAEERTYQKGEIILTAGDLTGKLGLLLSGSVTIETSDYWGNRSILSQVKAGQLFAEVFALLRDEPVLVDVQVSQECRVLFLDPQKLRDHMEPWAVKLLHNLLNISLHKNLALSSRSYHTAPKSARGRIMAYLNTVALQNKAGSLTFPSTVSRWRTI